MAKYIPVSGFHTFDPLLIDPETVIDSILASMAGDHTELKGIVTKVPEIESLVEGVPSGLDKATLLFLSCVNWDADLGSASESMDSGKGSKEKLGRWPTEDGNAIAYLIEYSTCKNNVLHELLAKLTLGLNPDFLGEEGFDGDGKGLELLGWLTPNEVKELRREITRGLWSVKANEPFDGGVQDGFRHLSIILSGAEKRGLGLLMRRHS
ncbi:MAG: hypothetical protein CMB75_01885 [Euryarchaeota archaeon]|nr:hypothetical protein [Euryarchaeota archaeon]